MYDLDLEDKINIIYLRSQLIRGNISKLKEIYSSKENYVFYLDTLNKALASEPAFFLLDESILDKAVEILHSKRFDYRRPEITPITNEIIERINRLRAVPKNIKNAQKRQYCIWQQEIRKTSFSSQFDFFSGLAYDAILIEKIYKGNLGETDPVYFFASTNYLAKVLPEFYQEDQNRIALTMDRLEQHAKKRWIWNWPERSFAKGAIKNIKKIKAKKEE